jgi:hypothetical protein
MDFQSGSKEEPNKGLPSYFEILKHSWPLLWEKPAKLIAFFLALALLRFVADKISNDLLEPFLPFIIKFKPFDNQASLETAKGLSEAIDTHGQWRLFLGSALPWLLMPISALALSRAALSIWDGYSAGLGDIVFAIRRYFPALLVASIVFLHCFFLAFILGLLFFPIASVQSLPQNPLTFITAILLLAMGVYFISFYVWPRLRCLIFLQFMAFFELLDGLNGHWWTNVTRIYKRMRRFPSHLNQAAIATLLVILTLMIPKAFILGMATKTKLPSQTWDFLAHAIDLLFIWPILALAGFYRLCHNPPKEDMADLDGGSEARDVSLDEIGGQRESQEESAQKRPDEEGESDMDNNGKKIQDDPNPKNPGQDGQ